MEFQETILKIRKIIKDLYDIANASSRHILCQADGKFQQDLRVIEEQLEIAQTVEDSNNERILQIQVRCQQHLDRLVTGQLDEIANQLLNLDKPVEQLEADIQWVQQQGKIIESRLKKFYQAIDESLEKFDKQYSTLVDMMVDNVKKIEGDIKREAENKLSAFLDNHIISVSREIKAWTEKEFIPFLEERIKEEVESTLLETESRIRQYAQETVDTLQIVYQQLVNDIYLHLPLQNHGMTMNYAKLVTDAVVGVSAGTTITFVAFHIAAGFSAPLAATLLGPLGLFIIAGFAGWQLLRGGEGIRRQIRAKVQHSLDNELPKALRRIAKDLESRLLEHKLIVVHQLREQGRVSGLDIKTKLQQSQDNLDQLLLEKKSQEFNVEQKSQLLKKEKVLFEKIAQGITTLHEF